MPEPIQDADLLRMARETAALRIETAHEATGFAPTFVTSVPHIPKVDPLSLESFLEPAGLDRTGELLNLL